MATNNIRIEHPEGKLKLSDGTVIDCYPLEHESENEELATSSSGDCSQENGEMKLFLDNAFLFFSHRERILSDSRMFLCKIPVCCITKINGEITYKNPTLGQYVEWWYRCGNSCLNFPCEELTFIYDFISTPVSKRKLCRLVNNKGEVRIEDMLHFDELWSSFIHSCNLYEEAKYKYLSYSLHEVLEIFQQEGRTSVDKRFIETYFKMQEAKVLWYNHRNEWLEWDRKEELYKKYLFDLRRKDLETIYALYKNKKKHLDKRMKGLQNRIRKILKEFNDGEMVLEHYIDSRKRLNYERREIEQELRICCWKYTEALFPGLDIGIGDIEDYFEKNLEYF